MKVLHPDSGFAEYQKVFKQLLKTNSRIVVWQVFPENGRRVINETILSSYKIDTQMLYLESVSDYLDPSLPLYCYVEDGQYLFKSSLKEVRDDVFSTLFPPEIRLLDLEDFKIIHKTIGVDISTVWSGRSSWSHQKDETIVVKSMSERSSRDQEYLNQEFDLTLDEEDKMYADKRESPRVRPKAQKLVKVVLKGEEEENLYDLFDLSRGGMAFITNIPEKYPKGSEVLVVGFDAFDLDDPLIGKVMSHRPLDNSQSDVKVGIKFHEGQD